MLIKNLIDEDFVNYKKPSMFIAFPYCSFKCCKEAGCSVCQNSQLAHEPNIEVQIDNILNRYINSPITSAIVCGGLEPLDSWEDLQAFICYVRHYIPDDIVIYTGYKEEEIKDKIDWLSLYENIIVKFGRFIPNQEGHYDEVLGVTLASPNQYAKQIGDIV